MKAKPNPLLVGIAIAILAVAIVGTLAYLRSSGSPGTTPSPSTGTSAGRRILYYQSSMHPWIRSDKPGRCTICGMQLSPVYEGDRGFDLPAGAVQLDSNSIQVINVTTSPARQTDLTRTLRVSGTIDDNDSTHRVLSAYTDGRIERLHVTFTGAEVVEGQPLLSFYSPMLLAAERDYAVLAQPGPGGTVVEEERHRLKHAATERLRRLGLTEPQIKALESKSAEARTTDITAPMSGSVVQKFVYEGQYVREGDRLFELADFSTMWFRFDVYEQDLPWVRPGLVTDVSTPSLPGRSFTGPITFIDPNLDPATRSAKARVELANPLIETNGSPRRLLLHRLFAEGRIQLQIPNVLAIPRSAVLFPGGDPVVYLDKDDGLFVQRKVRLGRTGDDDVEVLSGLEPGDRVVVQGNLLIDSQARIVSGDLPSHDHGNEPNLYPGQPHSAHSPETSTPIPQELSPRLLQLFQAAAAAGAALASDDLKAFNLAREPMATAANALSTAVARIEGWSQTGPPLTQAATLPVATSLADARKAFYPLSTQTVALARKFRRAANAPNPRIFSCPMVKDSVPGAGAKGEWIQMEGPLRNPFFGDEMLECGKEEQP